MTIEITDKNQTVQFSVSTDVDGAPAIDKLGAELAKAIKARAGKNAKAKINASIVVMVQAEQ